MNRETAKRLIRNTFEQPFDEDQFGIFIKELLNRIEEAPFTYRGNLIWDDFKDRIALFERIGKYEDTDGNKIDILIVHLKRTTSLERARATQRKFVAKYLKGSRGNELKDAALVAFVSPTEEDWRFSFVKVDYKIDSQKGKVDEVFTPAKRYSFLVGENESSHTAQSKLLPLLERTERDPTLKEIEEAFSVEKVTREFFEQYRELFLNLKESLDKIIKKDTRVRGDFKAKDVNTVDFAKKLLGQIVFLYFLQKKGWFGVKRDQEWGAGSKHFLRELFEKKHGEYPNFFNDILEPLFYEALRIEHPGDYYSRFDCRIPFLNGGLFDPINDYDWWNTDILLPDEMFSNRRKTLKGDTGDGILDVFDRYNFTVREDEPLEKEVAIDPELLGKAYEKFNAIRPDNYEEYKKALRSGNKGDENRFNKEFGVYYTPREIVHYMCQESLTNYLATALEGKVSKEDIQILIRYGEESVEHDKLYIEKKSNNAEYKGRYDEPKLPRNIEKHAKLIDGKLATIRVCDPAVGSGAFPVGMMHEIVRARIALAPYLERQAKRTPYLFKSHAIQNCLYGVDIDPGAVEIAKLRLWLSLVVDEEERGDIQPLPNLDYKIVQGNSLLGVPQNLFNQKLFDELEQLKPLYFKETNAREKKNYKRKIDELIEKITDRRKDFDFEIYFSEVFHEKRGFDIVIANPPYVSVEKFARTALQKEWKREFKTYASRGDIYCFFYEKGLALLRYGGILTFISSNKFQRSGYGKGLRELLVSQRIHTLIDFCELPVFGAAADPMIVIVEKATVAMPIEFPVLVVKEETEFGSLQRSVASRASQYRQDQLKIEGWSLEGTHSLKLVEKLRANGIPLGDYAKGRFFYGIKTGLNEAFVIDYATRDNLIREDHKSTELIKPWIRGKDIRRWTHEFHNLYVIIVRYGFHTELKNYSAVLNHLSKFRAKLKARGQCKTSRSGDIKGQHHWLELDNNPSESYISAFDEPKIVFSDIGKLLKAAFDIKGTVIGNTGYIIINPDEALLPILLSSTIDWYARSTFQALGDPWKGGRMRFIYQNMKHVPVPPSSLAEKVQLGNLSKRSAKLAKSGSPSALAEVEKKINEIVYRLFDLSSEEIAVVEGKEKEGQ